MEQASLFIKHNPELSEKIGVTEEKAKLLEQNKQREKVKEFYQIASIGCQRKLTKDEADELSSLKHCLPVCPLL